MKIVLLDSYTINPGDLSWEVLESLGEVICYDRTSIEDNLEILNRIDDAVVVISNRIPISNEIIERSTSLKLICVIDTSIDVVDERFAKEYGVKVVKISALGEYSLAQTAFALLFEICHRIQNHSDSVIRGDWEYCEDFCYWLTTPIELYGKTLGILGDTASGRISKDIAESLGMKVIVFDEKQKNSSIDLDLLIRSSDILFLMDDVTPITSNFIRKDNIKKMKDGVIIISNVSSDFVDEVDLADALNSSKVLSAALDVISGDSFKKDNPLLNAKNCIVTPRLSWATKENRKRILDSIAKEITIFMSEI